MKPSDKKPRSLTLLDLLTIAAVLTVLLALAIPRLKG